MPLIEQDIAESKKTSDWIKRNLFALNQDIQNLDNDANRDRECAAMWNADQNPSEFDYLTQFGEYELPAIVRFIPLIRPKGQRLIGDYIERPFIYSIFASDKESIRNKLDHKQDMIFQKVKGNLFDRLGNIQLVQQKVQEMLQASQQQQAPPGTAIQSGTAGNEQQIITPDAAQKMKVFQQIMAQEGVMTQKDIEKIEQMSGFSSLEMHEFLARETVEYLRYATNMDKVFIEGLEQKIINDKPYFYVDWETPFEDPVCKRVRSENFFYAFDDEIDYVQQSEWQCIREYMSIGNVVPV